MALDVFFRQDIQRILAGLLVAALDTMIANGESNQEHAAGILTLGKAIALAFGLSWAAVLDDVQAALTTPGAVDLLESTGRKAIEGGRRRRSAC